ncbi:Tetratricopeptide repeat-containing protein [Amycolatopsis pretoriensis]|uniref:Tetratricopeptide repeat-containing protein n=2 Tax=Amycolatopsis pretoriensis TaxID=218821 RepID=A0A1H5QN06_9PSEU|nr:Tetratricopeptide repeat-containing protein [Amycolatopsis pretoriensis]
MSADGRQDAAPATGSSGATWFPADGVDSTALGPNVPRQLPPPPPVFVDRVRELGLLTEWLRDRPSRTRAPIVVFSGLAGVGKSAVALTWAHRYRDLYPDGQLYADLTAYRRPGGVEMTEVLAAFLRALGVRDEFIPLSYPERSALFRSRTRGRKVLVLLDNSDAAAQVRPVIPGSPDSAVLVTSRRRLGGLVMDGADFVELPPLSVTDGTSLVRTILPGVPDAADEEAMAALTELCGGLPIALCIAGARLAERRSWTVARLVRYLSDDRLGRLSVEGDGAVGRVFDAAYEDLPEPARRLYRRLGLLPGTEFELGAAAAVALLSLADADDLTGTLVTSSLLEELDPERYRFHELVRLHARKMAEKDDSAAERDRATRGFVDWYLLGAAAADHAIFGEGRWRLARLPVDRWYRPFDSASALRWLERERSNLLDVVRTAWQSEWYETVWQFCEALWALYHSHKNHADWLAAHQLGRAAAQRCGNRQAEVRMCNQSARAHIELGEFTAAAELLESATEIAAGDARSEAVLAESLGLLHREQHRYGEAEQMLRRARDLNRAVGSARGVALQSYQLGDVLVLAGRTEDGLEELTSALAAAGEIDDELTAARVRIALGRAYNALRRDRDAIDALDAAVEITRRRGQPVKEAQALEVLIRIARRDNDVERFRESAGRLVRLYHEVGSPRSATVQDWLDGGPGCGQD